MKKLVSLLLVLMMLLACLPAMADEGPVAYDGSEVTITFDHAMGTKNVAVLETYIAEFNKLYPNIHVEHTAVGSYDDVRDQISKEIPFDQHPNLAYCYPDHVALYNMAFAVQTLDEYIDSTAVIERADGTTEVMGLTAEQKVDFIEGYYNEGKQFGDGKMYTLPMSKSTEVLYYNKTFFDANNIKVPTTWDEMEQVCQEIQKVDPKSIPLGYDSEANWFITMTEQYKSPYTSATGDHFLFDNEQNRAFVKRFCEWYTKGYLTTQELYGAYTSGLFVSTSGLESYMSIGSSAGATYQRPNKNSDGSYPFEVGIATIPQVDENNRKVISQGPSLVLFKKADAQQTAAAWLFMKYLTTDVAFQAEFAMKTGYLPVIKSVGENEVYADFINSADGGDNVAALSAKVCMEQQDAYYTSPAFAGSTKARDYAGIIITKSMTNTLGMDFTSEEVDTEIQKVFTEALDACNEFVLAFGD